MIARVENDTLLTFEKTSGMNAVFSGTERGMLLEYARTATRTPFIDRLVDLAILHDAPATRHALVQAEVAGPLLPAHPYPLPRTLHIELTGTCPFSCPQCYKDDPQHTDMPLALLESLITEAKNLRFFQIAFGGGEPMLYPHLIPALQRLSTTQMAVSITSSGYGITAERIRQLKKSGLSHIQISLNSLDETINSQSRQGYTDALQALHLLAGSGLSFGINWTARRENLDSLDGILRFAAQLEASVVNILRYKPSPREPYQDAALTPAQFARLAATICSHRGVRITLDSASSPLFCHIHSGKVSPLQSGCSAGKSFLAVKPDGTITPCSHLAVAAEKSTIQAYLFSPKLAFFLDTAGQLEGICKSCVYNNRCGGCRAVSFGTTGRFNSSEPDCPAYVKAL